MIIWRILRFEACSPSAMPVRVVNKSVSELVIGTTSDKSLKSKVMILLLGGDFALCVC